MSTYTNMFEGGYNPFDALLGLLNQEKACEEKS
jgi:hypothetical protein